MTSTTDRPVTPWPTRREREGGPPRRARTATRGGAGRPVLVDPVVAPGPAVSAERAAGWPATVQQQATGRSGVADRPAGYAPRHAAADPETTERLPIVVPAQRSAPVRPTPGPRSTSTPLPVMAPATGPAPVAAPPAAVPGPAPLEAGPGSDLVPAAAPTVAPVETPRPAPWRPAATPRPPRPAVGTVLHDVRPETRPMRNGLGLAAVCLGAIGLPLGLAPITGFAAAGLGVLALAFGIAGWSRVRSGTASNRGAAVTGAVLGMIALGLGVAGTIAFVTTPDRPVYDVDALTAGWTTATVVTPSGE